MDLTKLQSAGLSEKQSKIYLALIELKESGVTLLAKKTGINRSLLYFILEDLEKKGFVSYMIKNNVRYYKPVEPEKILDLIEEKMKSFKSVLPELIEIAKTKTSKPQIEVLEGIEGIKTILNEILRLKQNWYAYNVPGKGPEIIGFFADNFENQRQKARISLSVICNNTKSGKERGAAFSKMKHTKVKYLGDYESPASNYIYGDRVVVIFWYKEFPFAIRIIDKKLAESYKSYFKYLWNISEP